MTDFAARRRMMVDTQVRPSDVTKFPIISAMLAVPREDFVPAAKREAAYMSENIDLGEGRVVLEPRTFAKMLDALDITGKELVLDVGSALGYSSAVIAHMAASGCRRRAPPVSPAGTSSAAAGVRAGAGRQYCSTCA